MIHTHDKIIVLSAKNKAKNKKGVDNKIPIAQTKASAFILVTLHLLAHSSPAPTPITPEAKVTSPKI